MTMGSAFDVIQSGTVDVFNPDELQERLRTQQVLRVKLGIDPTASDLHLGHVVLLSKLRQFQDLGHEALLVFGDFTARIGDPTGKNATRQMVDPEDIVRNARTYTEQAFRILDRTRTRIVWNSEWLDALKAADLIQLAARSTVARMLERDDFQKRYHTHQAIAVHEFLYPLLQAYDSVVLQADVELGGTDQTFNVLMGRELQKSFGQKPQTVITLPLLEGLDGVHKMSKSLNNYIGFTEDPDQIFGKIMSLSDVLMWRYCALLSARSKTELQELHTAVQNGFNPRDVKLDLAEELVARFYDVQQAAQARRDFKDRFSKRMLPDQIAVHVVETQEPSMWIGYILVEAGFSRSTSEALRLMRQDAVSIDRTLLRDTQWTPQVGSRFLLEVGKRRITWIELRAT